jgi:hypothetical protein
MSRRRTAVVACSAALVVAIVVLVFTAGSRTPAQPDLTKSELVGTWVSGSSSLTFQADGSFEGLNVSGSGCAVFTAAGTWEFLAGIGDSPPPGVRYNKGAILGINLGGSLSTCAFQLTSWAVGPLWQYHPAVRLCFYADPDSPCVSPAFTKERGDRP